MPPKNNQPKPHTDREATKRTEKRSLLQWRTTCRWKNHIKSNAHKPMLICIRNTIGDLCAFLPSIAFWGAAPSPAQVLFGALPQAPLKKLLERSFLRIFKNFYHGGIDIKGNQKLDFCNKQNRTSYKKYFRKEF